MLQEGQDFAKIGFNAKGEVFVAQETWVPMGMDDEYKDVLITRYAPGGPRLETSAVDAKTYHFREVTAFGPQAVFVSLNINDGNFIGRLALR